MIVLIVVVVIIVVSIILLWIYGYNRIIALDRRADQAWSDIDVQLQRIAELLPNLINILKGQANFERDTLTKIADAYGKIVEAMRTPAIGERSSKASVALGVLYPIIYQLPQFPQLQSVQGFNKVMDELKVSMDKIAYSRQFYNQAVTEYNTFILSFPWMMIAKSMNKKERSLFNLPEIRREEIGRMLTSGDFTKEIAKI